MEESKMETEAFGFYEIPPEVQERMDKSEKGSAVVFSPTFKTDHFIYTLCPQTRRHCRRFDTIGSEEETIESRLKVDVRMEVIKKFDDFLSTRPVAEKEEPVPNILENPKDASFVKELSSKEVEELLALSQLLKAPVMERLLYGRVVDLIRPHLIYRTHHLEVIGGKELVDIKTKIEFKGLETTAKKQCEEFGLPLVDLEHYYSSKYVQMN